MVTATSTSQKAKAKLSGERRHGKTREDFEQQVVSAGDRLSLITGSDVGPHVADSNTGGVHGLGDGSKSQRVGYTWTRDRSDPHSIRHRTYGGSLFACRQSIAIRDPSAAQGGRSLDLVKIHRLVTIQSQGGIRTRPTSYSCLSSKSVIVESATPRNGQ